LNPQRFQELCAAMESEARATLTYEKVPSEKQRLVFSADLRYMGQFHEVSVALTEQDLAGPDLVALATRFHARHDQLYGYAVPTTPMELVTLRLTAIGITDKPRLPTMEKRPASSEHAIKGKRRAYLPHNQTFAEIPVYDGDALGYGNRLAGPALIEQATTTVFVPNEYDMECDALGSFTLFPKE
jgi:N-methylhydantoinase A